ncbi:MAG TPA: hypothetical protein VGK63_08345 [Candidatus Limnocylindrales bacterium]
MKARGAPVHGSPGRRAGIAAVILAVGLLVTGLAPAGARAATPAPTEPGVGDTRSSGEGAGFVGEPLVAAGIVVVVGLAAAGATLVYVRLSEGRRR